MSIVTMVIEAVCDALNECREEPCAECGSTGETMPCIVCDKLLCDECGEGTRWCKAHPPRNGARDIVPVQRHEKVNVRPR